MRIAFASEEERGLDSVISRKFGRAPYFILVDVEDGAIKGVKVITNPGSQVSGGAAVKAVQELINNRVNVVVAGTFGPHATVALEETGIKFYMYEGISVREALMKIDKEVGT